MIDEKVLLVGVAVNDRFPKVLHPGKSVCFVAVIEAFDAGAILVAGDVPKVNLAGEDVVEIPKIVGGFRGGMIEGFHRLGEVSHEAANVVVEPRISRYFSEDFAFQKSEHADREALHPGHGVTIFVCEDQRAMNFRCRSVEMIQHAGLEIEFLVGPPFVGDLENVTSPWRFDPRILIFIRIKRGDFTVDAVKVHGNSGELLVIE